MLSAVRRDFTLGHLTAITSSHSPYYYILVLNSAVVPLCRHCMDSHLIVHRYSFQQARPTRCYETAVNKTVGSRLAVVSGKCQERKLCACLYQTLKYRTQGKTQTYYAQGFPVGFMDTSMGKYYVNNHVHMVVDYHPMTVEEVNYFYFCAMLPSVFCSFLTWPVSCSISLIRGLLSRWSLKLVVRFGCLSGYYGV